jgi:hypothetical protein
MSLSWLDIMENKVSNQPASKNRKIMAMPGASLKPVLLW